MDQQWIGCMVSAAVIRTAAACHRYQLDYPPGQERSGPSISPSPLIVSGMWVDSGKAPAGPATASSSSFPAISELQPPTSSIIFIWQCFPPSIVGFLTRPHEPYDEMGNATANRPNQRALALPRPSMVAFLTSRPVVWPWKSIPGDGWVRHQHESWWFEQSTSARPPTSPLAVVAASIWERCQYVQHSVPLSANDHRSGYCSNGRVPQGSRFFALLHALSILFSKARVFRSGRALSTDLQHLTPLPDRSGIPTMYKSSLLPLHGGARKPGEEVLAIRIGWVIFFAETSLESFFIRPVYDIIVHHASDLLGVSPPATNSAKLLAGNLS
ncbi:hypothetical protein ASPZODRAFT_17206 [Penicilliopsis zonata CBS 506.65]|uniref:Uncharacterized protein n=1 Tax=Penicilliopsis zonata CBS 506.65 TaxID=1073090 RepID=A0A1L9SFH9_9EURO|nr:hypothetical protein ASPZODRAFT_17206 [Penicilliopsis zonata CBS 506.65]OJJ45764.1 hypothetical protein ASPZODRAFT_17206 [Penicilliopsis zonata CBS 506.65]